MQILDEKHEITNIPGQSVKEVIINLRTKKTYSSMRKYR
jgi:hypothetical protein